MKVSIVIPVYNCEKYLSRCIESVLNQDYHNIELILVNDGSTDSSSAIMESFYHLNKDKIILYHQKNAGAAMARNKGIELASGEYMTFIDSDDYIEKDFIKTLLSATEGREVIVSGYKKTNAMGEVMYAKIPEENEWSLFKYTTNWGNLYKTQFIKDNEIKFSRYRIGEDIDFTLQCIVLLHTYTIVKYAGYYYFTNEDSVTNTIKKVQNVSSLIELFEDLDERAVTHGYHNQKNLYYFFLKTSIFNLYMQRKDVSVKKLQELFLDEYHMIEKMQCLCGFKHRLAWVKSEDFYINILFNVFVIAYKLHVLPLLLSVLRIV